MAMKKATRIIGYVLLVSGLNVGLAAAQSTAPASASKFVAPKPVLGTIPTGIVLTGFRPLIDPPTLGFRPLTSPPLRPLPAALTGKPRPTLVTGWPSPGLPKPLLGLPKPGSAFGNVTDLPKPITLSDVNGYDH
jgi:hypothetical protein